MREDIIKLLASHKALTHVFITTFNIDFIFIESILLRELRKCGHPSLTVLADADEVAAAFASQGRWLSRIGRRYRVVPIRMEPGFRFHPKVIMLAGRERADLFVGSGNLTFGGMRQNDEFWLRFQSDEDGSGPLAASRDFFEACLSRAPHPQSAQMELREAFDANQHKWAELLAAPSGMIAKVGTGPSLMRQMVDAVGDLVPNKIIVGSPYFDEPGDALAAIAEQWPEASLDIMFQPGQSQLLSKAWRRIRTPKSLTAIDTSRGECAHAFIHAKFYAFVGASEAVLLVGSANCSRAALLLEGALGNAEAMAIVRLSPQAVEDAVYSGVRSVEMPAQLRTELPPSPPPQPAPAIRILDAHHAYGELLVAFAAPVDAAPTELLADSHVLVGNDIQVSSGVVRVRNIGLVSRVRLVAMIGGARHVSAEHWVDHEVVLSASSQRRRVAETIGDRVAPGQWTFQGWTEVLRILGNHLTHTPAAPPGHQQRHPRGREEHATLSPSDFFTEDYRLPGRNHHTRDMDEATRVLGLRDLLLEYFGVPIDDHDTPDSEEEGGDEDTVDKPEAPRKGPPTARRQKAKHSLTDAERRRAQRMAKRIVDVCTSPEFARTRPATLMGPDLAIVAMLLISGYAERWLNDEDFLDLTYSVWTFLFFDDSVDKHQLVGAIARRHDVSPDPCEFEESLRSVRLAAALATWCFCCPNDISHPEAVRFEVATRLAIARLPWLWHLEARDEVENELFEIAQRTGWLGMDMDQGWGRIVSRWNTLFADGHALTLLERTLTHMELPALRDLVTDDEVPAGTLLWQGPKMGFCVLGKAARRRSQPEQSFPIMTLRSTRRDTKLQAKFLLPFRRVLRVSARGRIEPLKEPHVSTLETLAERLESMWSATHKA